MIFGSFFAKREERAIRSHQPTVEKINDREARFQGISDEGLRGNVAELKEKLADGVSLDDILPEAFALVREAAERTLKQRHYDVQLLGGIVLHNRAIAEMRTGEGKTLVATLPVFLNALTGKGVHVITVNDYLARRDGVWMGQVYAFLGLSVGVLNNNASYLYDPAHTEKDTERDAVGSFKVMHQFLRPCAKQEAYAADITYGTNNEFAFDYLRDNLAYTKETLVQRPLHYAIVDEVDSILIDEARTPLIISAPSQDPEQLYHTFAKIASGMEVERDYTIDEKLRAIQLTDDGIARAEKTLGVENIYTEKGIKYVHHLENAVRAKALFLKEREYVVRSGEVVIVDEFTGRLQPGRRWSEGLHQAIEAKEGVPIQKESTTVASITFQNYFRLYEKIAGMTGTALTSAEEFQSVYNLDVIPIPTHRVAQRIDGNDLIFQTEKGKWRAVTARIKELHATGQPILVGTVSIEKNELLSEYLKVEGVPHQVLNAKNHEQEGEIIAQAGRRAGVTIATNMAGRGVDIILGGNPPNKEEQEKVRELGGLFVIGTERHDARRIDNQLRGRSARQGDPGATQFYVSLEDSLMRIFATDTVKNMIGRFGISEDQPIENRMINKALESAQTKIEGFHFDARKHVLAFDDVMNHQRKSIYGMRHKILLGNLSAAREFLAELLQFEKGAHDGIEKKKAEVGEEAFLRTLNRIVLQALDIHWMEHLEAMDYLRSSVNLRAYGQRDPLVEYKKEGLRLFREMKESVYTHVVDMIPRIGAEISTHNELPHDAPPPAHISFTSANVIPGAASLDVSKVGRNDPCPCGSGKKYKKCHGS